MVSIVGLVLMVVSNAVSWYMVTVAIATATATATDGGGDLSVLRSSVWKISLFYTLWALYNRYLGGKSQELGHVSMGLLTLTCFFNVLATTIPLMLSCGLVVLNFAVVIPMIISMKGPSKFAKKVWKGDTSTLAVIWGYTFTAYILSNIVMWSYVLFQFYQLPVLMDVDVDLSTDTTDPTIVIGETEPLQTADL